MQEAKLLTRNSSSSCALAWNTATALNSVPGIWLDCQSFPSSFIASGILCIWIPISLFLAVVRDPTKRYNGTSILILSEPRDYVLCDVTFFVKQIITTNDINQLWFRNIACNPRGKQYNFKLIIFCFTHCCFPKLNEKLMEFLLEEKVCGPLHARAIASFF